MVTILGFMLVIGAFIYYAITMGEIRFDDESEYNKIKKTAMFIGGIGCGLVIVNSWIVSPILRMIGG